MISNTISLHFGLNNETPTKEVEIDINASIETVKDLIWQHLEYSNPSISLLNNHKMLIFTLFKNELEDSYTLSHYVSNGLIYNEDILYVSIHLHTSAIGKYIDTISTYINCFCVNLFSNPDYFNLFTEKPNHNYLFYWKI